MKIDIAAFRVLGHLHSQEVGTNALDGHLACIKPRTIHKQFSLAHRPLLHCGYKQGGHSTVSTEAPISVLSISSMWRPGAVTGGPDPPGCTGHKNV
jgi:hypothetical protein